MEAVAIVAAVNTIGKTAETAWNIADTLQRFVRDAKHVDETVRELHLEVTRLPDASSLARDQLNDLNRLPDSNRTLPIDQYLPPSSHPPGHSHLPTSSLLRTNGHHSNLLTCFDDLNKDVDRTLDQLSQAIGAERYGRHSLLKRSVRQLQLNMNNADITAARDRVRSHTGSLQLILLTINIEISNVAPQRANQELITKIDRLTELVNAFPPQQAPQPNAEVTLLEYAEHVAESARSLRDRSTTSGSVGDSVVLITPEVDRISEWLGQLDYPSTTADEESQTGTATPGAVASSIVSDRINTPDPNIEEVQDLDTDGKMYMEIANTWLELGSELFENAEYKEAHESFQEAYKALEKLSNEQQMELCDPWILQCQSAISSYYFAQPNQVKATLLKIVTAGTRDESARPLIFLASHFLAQVCIKLNQLQEARKYCEYAFAGRKSKLGRSHKDTKQSIALLARILQLTGEMSPAKRGMFEKIYGSPKCFKLYEPLTAIAGQPSESPNFRGRSMHFVTLETEGDIEYAVEYYHIVIACCEVKSYVFQQLCDSSIVNVPLVAVTFQNTNQTVGSVSPLFTHTASRVQNHSPGCISIFGKSSLGFERKDCVMTHTRRLQTKSLQAHLCFDNTITENENKQLWYLAQTLRQWIAQSTHEIAVS